MASTVGEGMVTAPKPPIFILDTNHVDVAVFATVEEAEGHIEVVDFERGEFEAFDAMARPLKIEKRGHDLHIEGTFGDPSEGYVRDRIAMFLSAIGQSVGDVAFSRFVELASEIIIDWQSSR